MKIWSSDEKGDDKIIAYLNNIIYQGNPKQTDIENVISDLRKEVIPPNNFIGIPLSYLKEIHLQDGSNYIEILFGKESNEQLKVSDSKKRLEIFEYFKANIPNAKYSVDKYSKLRSGKKPMIAMSVVFGLFIWTFYVSNGMANGNEYKVVGEQRSVATIILVIASMGTTNVLLIFGSLFVIALISFIYKIRNPKVVQKIIVQR
jgi:hypothetical protein